MALVDRFDVRPGVDRSLLILTSGQELPYVAYHVLNSRDAIVRSSRECVTLNSEFSFHETFATVEIWDTEPFTRTSAKGPEDVSGYGEFLVTHPVCMLTQIDDSPEAPVFPVPFQGRSSVYATRRRLAPLGADDPEDFDDFEPTNLEHWWVQLWPCVEPMIDLDSGNKL